MDGPHVNWKFLEVYSSTFNERLLHSLINTGTYSLDIVYGSLSTGENASKWGLIKIMKGACHIFYDSPTGREE